MAGRKAIKALTKAIIRRQMLLRRNKMTSALRHEKSLRITRRFLRLPEYKEAKSILFFKTHGSEVNTDLMIGTALSEGKKVALPYVTWKGRLMQAARFDFMTPLVRGAYGIWEVAPHKRKSLALSELSLVVVPGLAFDKRGARIGYGKGYYDRFLLTCLKNKRLPLVACAFDFQILRKLPEEQKDISVSMIVTEKRLVRTRLRLS